MTSTFGTRLVALRAARQLTQHELAAASGVSRSRIAVIEKSTGNPPHATTVARLAKALGVRVSALYGEPDGPTPPATPGAAAALPFSGELLDRLLTQINSQAQQHREELALLKKEHRAALNKQTQWAQYTMDMMTLAAEKLSEKIYFMEGRLGLRPPTAEEVAAQQALEAPRAKKIGLKHYDESSPTGRHLSLFGGRVAGEAGALLAA